MVWQPIGTFPPEAHRAIIGHPDYLNGGEAFHTPKGWRRPTGPPSGSSRHTGCPCRAGPDWNV